MDTSPETLNPDTAPTMRLRVAFVHWLVAIVLVMALASIAVRFESGALGWLAVGVYLGAGVYLNRVVLRQLITWHPVYSTLANVADEKVKMFVLWPLSYFFLFLRLAINRVL